MTALLDEAGGSGALAMITDITGEHRATEELRRRGLHDALTGLPNRIMLTEALDRALERSAQAPAGSVAVLIAGLDGFKLINDSWGHPVGDDLLRAVAARLSSAVGPADLVARLGSDEFVVLREGADAAGATELAQRLQDALAAPFDLVGNRCYVSASIGIAVSPPSPGIDVLRFADAAMYDAKDRGRGRSQLFESRLADEAAGRLVLGNDLREALTSDQLELYYQPIVDLATGHLSGVEALARWKHPMLGDVSPSEFVPLAEALGLARTLDQWVLNRATRDLARIRACTDPHLRMSVNLSAVHLADSDVERTVADVLEQHELGYDALELEITESGVMDNPEYAQAMLRRLKNLGVAVAIDDFGTGYSSLAYLSRLPATTLKIDQTFVRDMTTDPDALAIVASVIDLTRAMRLLTIAEGVETIEQLTLLHRLGCICGQGYLWSPALPLDDFVALIDGLPNGRFDVTRLATLPAVIGVAWSQAEQPETVMVLPAAPSRPEIGVRIPVRAPGTVVALAAAHLSAREWEIVTRLGQGRRVPAIATDLFLTQGTVRNQLSSVYRKLGLHSQQELLDLINAESTAHHGQTA